MMNNTKVLILIVCMLFTNVFVFADGKYSDNLSDVTMTTDIWQEYMVSYDLPANTATSIIINGAVLPFNTELLEDKGVVVYGDYSVVPKNDFKVVASGYYNKNESDGEYRYHGYTVDLAKHGNDQFPRDASSATPLEEKKWVITPWKVNSFSYASFDNHVGEPNTLNDYASQYIDYTDEEINSNYSPEVVEELNTLKQMAVDGMTFQIQDGTFDGITKYIRPSDGSVVLDPIYYANMQTIPTTRLSGQSILFHKSVWDGNSWYQTFSMNRTKTKINTPVVATIEEYHVSGVENTGQITLNVKVQGHLQDDNFYIPKDQLTSAAEAKQIDNATRYHRDDIISWDIILRSNNLPIAFEKVGSVIRTNEGNKAYQWFKVDLLYSDYEAVVSGKTILDISITGRTTSNFTEGNSSFDEVTDVIVVDAGEIKTDLPPEVAIVEFDVTAPNEILDVWNFPVSLIETNVPSKFKRSIVLEGVTLSETDEAKFISGTYKFPELRETKLYNYCISYTDGNEEFHYASWILVYDSIPHASVRVVDSGKVNRKNTVTADSTATPDFVEANSSISITNFSVTARNGQSVYFGTNTIKLKEYLVKQIDTVDVNVTVTNEYGSRSYNHEIYAGEDYIPDLISIIWNNNLARNDSLDIFSEGASLDEDTVGSVFYEIFYDADRDGIAETSVYSKSEFLGTTTYVPDKLGYYEIEFTVTEAFGQETIEAYINPEDYMSNTVRREFFVDNLVPMTKVYSDIEFNFPEIDMTFLVDEDYPRTEMNYISSNNVEIRNDFRLNSMIASLQTWDMHTYTYSQSASTSLHTGSSYPPSSTYYSSGGYSGTLSRYRVDNYSYSVDRGSYQTTTDSKTAYGSQSQSNTILLPQYSDSDRTPSSMSYNSGGYSGTLYKYGRTSYSSTEILGADGEYLGYSYTATFGYSGTVSKTTTVWVPSYSYYNDYYGRYSGTVYKNIKQSFSPTYSTESNKYIVYFATNNISNLSDYQSVKNIAVDSKLIVVGEPSIQGTMNEDYFIPYTNDTQSIIDQIVSTVKAENPFSNELSVLVGETFDLSYADIDAESDPIVEEGFQYKQDQYFFDNEMGLNTNAYASYDASQYSATILNSFNKTGKFSIYRRIKDAPIEDPSKGLFSNLSVLDIMVHRRPIADYKLDWTYDAEQGHYETNWIDQSYDLDFEISDPINKGIVNRKVKYRKDYGPWIYEVPDKLTFGTYNLEYIVQDNFGIWSYPKVETFTLSSIPSPQLLDAKIRVIEDCFTINEIPGTEFVELYDIKTRFPYNALLEIRWYKNGLSVTEPKHYQDQFITIDSDEYWNDIILEIPKGFADDTYELRLSVVDEVVSTNRTSKSFNVGVMTPIDLEGSIDSQILVGSNQIYATASVYVDAVNAKLFRGTAYETIVPMSKISNGNWHLDFDVNELIPSDLYQIELEAEVHSNPIKKETILLSSELITMKATSIVLIGDWNYWTQSENIFGETLQYHPHRFFALENIQLFVETIGEPESIFVEVPDVFKAQYYMDKDGHTYDNYLMTNQAPNFPKEMDTNNSINWSFEYMIPLVNSTLNLENQRLNSSYSISVTLIKGGKSIVYTIDDIEITGNTLDHIYLQPNY